MSDTNAHRHGLESFLASVESATEARVRVSVVSDRGFLNLRLDPRNGAAAEAARILGQPLPPASSTYTEGVHCVYWLGPDEWLIETGADRSADLASELSEALAGRHAAVNDVSGGHVAMCVSGADARTVLAKGCTLDLHPREFGPGQCARASLAKAVVVLCVADDAPTYSVIVGRSSSDYLCRWLAHAARSHGVRFSILQDT